MNEFSYPKDLLPDIKKRFFTSSNILTSSNYYPQNFPTDDILENLLTVAYHASFLMEESRKIGFRLAYCSMKDISKIMISHPDPTPFDKVRPYSVNEIVRLSPAVDFTSTLICVTNNEAEGGLNIWGLWEISSSWWELQTGGIHPGYSPPDYLIILSREPGTISCERGWWDRITLRGGTIQGRELFLLQENDPLMEFLQSSVDWFSKICTRRLKQLKMQKPPDFQDTIEIMYRQMILRLLHIMRDNDHGGSIVLLPDPKKGRDKILNRFNVKYSIDYNNLRISMESQIAHKYEIQAWLNSNLQERRELATEEDIENITNQINKSNNLLADSLNFISRLCGTDGTVILTDRFRVLGFGAEIVTGTKSLDAVWEAKDMKGKKIKSTPIDNFGTRHRSMFRYCHRYSKNIGLLVSQDGGVKIVKRMGDNLVFWNIPLWGV